MKRRPELPADFVRGYWGAVRGELVSKGLTGAEAGQLIVAYRKDMKNAPWAVYNTTPEDTAANALFLKQILDDKKAGRWKPSPPTPVPPLPERAVNSYWTTVRTELVKSGLSEPDADAAIQAYRTLRQGAGMGLYNDNIAEATKYVLEYRQNGRVVRAVKTVFGEVVGHKVYPPDAALIGVRGPKVNNRRPHGVVSAGKPSTLPTKKEIARLPHWARVAFAARCARRVLPLFEKYRATTPATDRVVVSRAVEAAELSSTFAFGGPDRADAARDAASKYTKASDSADAVFVSAIYAADAAVTYSETIASTFTAATSSARSTDGWILPLIRQDFELVSELSQVNKWTDATPVPPAVFGPLWPEGPPADWPVLPKPTKLKLSVQVPDGLDDTIVREKLQTLTAALARLNVVGGGHGLELVRPIDFTQEQERGRADVVEQETKATKGGGNARRGH